MRFDVVTLFPELFAPHLETGVTRRAFESGQVDVELWPLRDFALDNYRRVDDGRQGALRIFLKYGPGWERVITDLQRVSRPGCRIYCGKDEIPRVYGGLGINILSTSRGLMTGRSAAREGVGGEILCNVW